MSSVQSPWIEKGAPFPLYQLGISNCGWTEIDIDYSIPDFLPRALNTRRRYSAFRPVPLPLQGHVQSYTSVTDAELANIELMEQGNLLHKSAKKVGHSSPKLDGSSSSSSDLEQFLTGHNQSRKGHLDETRSVTSWVAERFHRLKDKMPLTLLCFISVIALVHLIAFISFFASPERNSSTRLVIQRCAQRHGNITFCKHLHETNMNTWNDTG